jgi:hypothetical protein
MLFYESAPLAILYSDQVLARRAIVVFLVLSLSFVLPPSFFV